MSRRLVLLLALGTLLPLASCGNNAPKSGSTAGAAQGGATTSGRAPAPGGGAGGGGTRPPASAILPATFTLSPQGALSPASVSGPTGVPILLTIVSRDSRDHEVTVGTRPTRKLAVPPGVGRVSIKLGVLPKGTYSITVDGSVRGHLIVGVAPGP
jgi:hypothetical protein